MIRVSVVATGMDGASIAAIEPKLERRPLTAPPLTMPSYAPAPEAVAASASAEPLGLEPALAAEAAEEEQPDLYAAPVAAEAPALGEPTIVAPVTRIVDPAVADAGDEPLFAPPAYEERRPRGGFLSIFGSRPRYDAPQPQAAPAPRPAAVRGGAQPLEAAQPEEEAQQGEDLEIPSFLRRLAN
jgi:cell division protein FtsZ